MGKCKHENADHLKPGECLVRWDDIGRLEPVLVEQFRCLDCGAWLSLGPATDTAETAIEVRAAELAARSCAGMAGCERCGELATRDELVHQPIADHTANEFEAGWLARQILDHEDSP